MQRISSQADFVSVLELFRYGIAAGEVAPTSLKASTQLPKAMQLFGPMEKDDD
ncbi:MULTISPECIES: hypothetical protein [unclassified Pseudomonas]|uniref:hypothetical protein n=1 Tax=unclassified Pseudomonas TaxID=196821 RepID=UPI0015AFE4C0|nr:MULTISPECIES: hypothetical protein [unclassified Pseudomonas]